MEIHFWGVRGSVPVSGRDTARYGGHTLCTSIKSSAGGLLIVDAGTGIRQLGGKLMGQSGRTRLRLDILLTHFHLDHIIGLPFFAPLYSPRAQITFHSPAAPNETEKYLGGLQAGRYFPVAFKETGSRKAFRKLEETGVTIGKLRVSSCPLIHPQGSVAYRFEENGRSVVLATDTEPPEGGLDDRLADFIRGATFFIYDAMFTPEEYLTRQGWGHSTWLEGTKLARKAGVKNLVLSHFSPDHTDRRVDEIVRLAKKEFPRTMAAREGRTVRIDDE
ncbi:MAG: MBL fold metallo-hydrolase [Candidatus Aminicenantales bacterium]